MAIYTPAISTYYVKNYAKGLPHTYDLLSDTPCALYSAGHDNVKKPLAWPVTSPLREFLIGDSGGFQIGKGKWKADWVANDQKAQDYMVNTLNWLQQFDAHMTLDVPLYCINNPNVNINSKQEVFDVTHRHNRHYLSSKKIVLNVMSGVRNIEDTIEWVDEFSPYSDPNNEQYFTGYAFAVNNVHDFGSALITLRRLLEHRRLSKATVMIHFLGTSKVWQGWLYAVLEQVLKDRIHEDFVITYDSASPFLAAVNNTVYVGANLNDRDYWALKTEDIEEVSDTFGDYMRSVLNDPVVSPRIDNMPCNQLLIGGRGTQIMYPLYMNQNVFVCKTVHEYIQTNFKTLTPGQIVGTKTRLKNKGFTNDLFEESPNMPLYQTMYNLIENILFNTKDLPEAIDQIKYSAILQAVAKAASFEQVDIFEEIA